MLSFDSHLNRLPCCEVGADDGSLEKTPLFVVLVKAEQKGTAVEFLLLTSLLESQTKLQVVRCCPKAIKPSLN